MKRNNKGFALPVVLTIVFFGMFLTMAVLVSQQSTKNLTSKVNRKLKVQTLSQAGILHTMLKIKECRQEFYDALAWTYDIEQGKFPATDVLHPALGTPCSGKPSTAQDIASMLTYIDIFKYDICSGNWTDSNYGKDDTSTATSVFHTTTCEKFDADADGKDDFYTGRYWIGRNGSVIDPGGNYLSNTPAAYKIAYDTTAYPQDVNSDDHGTAVLNSSITHPSYANLWQYTYKNGIVNGLFTTKRTNPTGAAAIYNPVGIESLFRLGTAKKASNTGAAADTIEEDSILIQILAAEKGDYRGNVLENGERWGSVDYLQKIEKIERRRFN